MRMKAWFEQPEMNFRESEMGFGGRGGSVRVRVDKTFSKDGGERVDGGQGHLSRGGTRWREREGRRVNGTSEPGEAIKPEGTRVQRMGMEGAIRECRSSSVSARLFLRILFYIILAI